MSDLYAGVGITLVVAVLVVLPAVLVARWQDRRQARARHCLRRPHPAVILVRDLLGLLRPAPRYVDTSRTLAEMVGPIVTDAEADEEFERMPLAPESHPYPLRPTVLERPDGHILIDEGERIHVRPAVPPVPPPVVYDTLYDLPVVPRYARQVVYGEACELDVEEAERLAAAMLP